MPKVKIQIEVTDGSYNEIFAYKNVTELDIFSKQGLLGVLNDTTGDIVALINRSVSMQKVEDKHLLNKND